MKFSINSKQSEVAAFCVFEKESLSGKLGKELSQAVKKKRFNGKFGEIFKTKSDKQELILIIGLGNKKEFSLERLRRVVGKLVKQTKAAKYETLSIDFDCCKGIFNAEELGAASAESALLANYSFDKYFSKEKKEKKRPLETLNFAWAGSKNFGVGLKRGKVIGEASNFVRDLVNEPAGVAHSLFLEKVVKNIVARHSKLRLKVLNKPELKKLGMGALLGVNAGSSYPPKLIFIEYRGKPSGKWTALVGKGITFDSGGYNLKPTKYIEDMKSDMAGSAAVLGTIKAAAELGIKQNIVGVMAVCENMVSSLAQRPGDIVKAYNGKTIEIGNTDAEGRLVLADALAYTEKKYQPEVMIDLATLTGACVVALGYYAAAVVSKDERLVADLKNAGDKSGDRIWQLPFYEEYHDAMDGSISDLNNISQKGKGYEGGSITAGVFLSKFVEKSRWAHLDIAGSAYWGVNGDYLGKGPTGSGVRALCYYLLNK